MEQMIAYCGLVCTECEAYAATQADDREALERVAAHWREEYSAPQITVSWVICDGCVADSDRRCGHCSECDIRACGTERQVANCAHCSDYACQKLGQFFAMVPAARAVLEGVRASLTMPGAAESS
jgi:hypothetical protein